MNVSCGDSHTRRVNISARSTTTTTRNCPKRLARVNRGTIPFPNVQSMKLRSLSFGSKGLWRICFLLSTGNSSEKHISKRKFPMERPLKVHPSRIKLETRVKEASK